MEGYPYFVTTATHRRTPIFADTTNAELLMNVLYETRERYSFLILSFVLMPDHFHAVLARQGDTISQVMRFIKGTYARTHNERSRTVGPVWQTRFYERVVRDEDALRSIIQYVEWNPLRAGLARSPDECPFSSAHPDRPVDLETFFSGQAEGRANGW